jgi:signal transduction histidine kinase/CheY-like chemotaxis protein/proteasome lid subunit RPN8/RPN11
MLFNPLKKFNIKTFRARIFIRFLILVIAISFSFTFIFIQHQHRTLSDTLVKEGLSLVKLFASNARLGVFSGNPEFLKEAINAIKQRDGILSASIYDLDGNLLSGQNNSGTGNISAPANIMAELNKSREPIYFERADHFEIWAPVITAYEKSLGEVLYFDEDDMHKKELLIGFATISISKDILKTNFRAVLFKSLVILFGFLSLGSLIAFIASKEVIKPLDQLLERVSAIKKGQPFTRLHIKTKDEIGKLSAAFNDMAESLRKREDEKHKLMEQLSQSKRIEAIETLAGGIAHDFNNILAIIQAHMNLAQKKAPKYLKGHIEQAINAVKRGVELVTSLMQFSRETPESHEEVNIALVVSETVKLLMESKDNSEDTHIDVPPDLWTVKADAGKIRQIIMNLYLNASDALRERTEGCNIETSGIREDPPAINIGLRNITIHKNHLGENPKADMSDYVLLSVKDNGCGMDKETTLHIYEPFFTTKKAGKGTGLGLSTVYGIVNSHGGWIEVQSTIGKGTVFDVYLPRFKGEHKETKTIVKQSESYEAIGGNETILVVDDEVQILEAVKEKMEDLGYKVLTANSGEKAIEIIKKKRKKIDLVILDEVMPGISGIEVLQNIRRLNPKTKVLMHSGKDLSRHAHILEDVEVINKPYDLDALAGKIGHILGSEWRYPFKSHLKRVKLYYVEEPTVPHDEDLSDPDKVYRLFRHIENEPRETFLAVYLDSQNKIIAYDKLSTGTTDETVVYPKEVIRTALLANACAVILVHNHPAGGLRPSSNDIALTASIKQAFKMYDIKLHDHIVISDRGYLSFVREGLL